MGRTPISLEELVRDVAKDADFEAQSRQVPAYAAWYRRKMMFCGSPSLLHSADGKCCSQCHAAYP